MLRIAVTTITLESAPDGSGEHTGPVAVAKPTPSGLEFEVDCGYIVKLKYREK